MSASAFRPVALSPDLTDGVLWRRFVAWLLDFVFIAVIAAAIWAVLFVLGVLTLGLGFGLMLGLPAVPLAYHILFVAGWRHATPGQAMMDLVVRRHEDLGPPNLAQAVVFTAGLWITLGIGFWPFLVVFFTTGGRALHDIVAGVVVLRRQALTRHGGFANMAPK